MGVGVNPVHSDKGDKAMWHKAIVGALSLCAAVLLTGCANTVVSENAGNVQNGPSLTNAEGRELVKNLRIDWAEPTGARAIRDIYCDAGIVYVEYAYGTLFALSQETGRPVWLCRLLGALDYPPCSTENKVFFFTDGTMHILDKATGKVLAKRNAHIGIIAPPMPGSKSVIVASAQGQIVGLSEDNGSIAWTRATDTLIIGSALIPPDKFFGLTIDGEIRYYDAGTAEAKWQIKIPGPTPITAPLATAHGLFVGGRDNTVYAFGLDGAPIWKKLIGRVTVAKPAMSHGKLIVITDPDTAVVLNEATGDELWRQPGAGRFITATADRAYFLDPKSETLVAFNFADGTPLGKLDVRSFQRFCGDAEAGFFFASTPDCMLYKIVDTGKPAPSAAAPATAPVPAATAAPAASAPTPGTAATPAPTPQ